MDFLSAELLRVGDNARHLGRDLRLALARLGRERAFTATVLFIFALCVAANVAIFAVVNDLLLKPLPFPQADRLVIVYNAYPGAGVDRSGVSVPHFLERKAGIAAIADAACYSSTGATLGGDAAPERIAAERVTSSFFRVLDAAPAMGRTFTDDDGVPGKELEVVLSDGLWRGRFAADPQIIGRSIRMDSKNYQVIGVMPPGFHFLGEKAQLWKPMAFTAEDRGANQRHSNNMDMFARLKPGATIAEAQLQVDALNAQTLKTDPFGKLVSDAGFHTTVRGLQSDFVADLGPVLRLLQVGVLGLLLIGALNVANLLLVRATGRTKEFAVRQALGGSRAQLARALIVETLVLTVAGGLLGIIAGAAALRGIWLVAAAGLPVATIPSLDLTVVLGALGVSILVGLALSVPVVWHTLQSSPASALAAESRGGTTSRSVHRLRHTLIVAQIALAFILISGTGLLGLSFSRILAVRPGFQPEQVLTARIALPKATYPDAARSPFVTKLMEAFAPLPGVKSVGVGTNLPFGNNYDNSAVTVEGRALESGESLRAHYLSGVSGDYFDALGIPLLEGRLLTTDDSTAERKVCVVDAAVAQRYWPNASALGHRLVNGAPGTKEPWYTIVGVVGSVKQKDLAEKTEIGAVYFPFQSYAGSSLMLAVRTENPAAVTPEIRTALLRLDPELPMSDLKPMALRIDDSVANRRSPFLLAGIFAAVALVLAAVGIYGVLAYSVAQRRREIGVRMALGAQPVQILRQFLGLGGQLLAFGLPMGLIGAWLGGRAMASLLFGVAPADPRVLGGTAIMLMGVALVACLLPSRRAAQVAPSEALRA